MAVAPAAELEAIYRQACLAVDKYYLRDAGRVQDGDWLNRYKGRLRNNTELANAVYAMLAARADKYCAFMTRQQALEMEFSDQGIQTGVGISLDVQHRVSAVSKNSPAAKAKLTAGDLVLKVNSRTVAGLDHNQVLARISDGMPGSLVSITYRRADETYTLTLPRIVVGHTSALTADDAASDEMWQGYDRARARVIRIASLRNDGILKDLRAELNLCNDEGVAGVLLDLRGVNGGSGEVAAQVAALFLQNGLILSSTQLSGTSELKTSYSIEGGKLVCKLQKLGQAPFQWEVPGPTNLYNGVLMVAVDERTTGAAEFVAAALKEHGRGRVVGRKTAGKGTSLATLPIGSHHVLKLSTGRYLTAAGSLIDKVGVTPDAVVRETDDFMMISEIKNNHFAPLLPISQEYGGQPLMPRVPED